MFRLLALLTLIQPMHTMDLEVAADGSASPPTSPPSAPTPPPSAAASAVPPPPTGPTYSKQFSGTPSSSALITTLAECEAAASILGVSYDLKNNQGLGMGILSSPVSAPGCYWYTDNSGNAWLFLNSLTATGGCEYGSLEHWMERQPVPSHTHCIVVDPSSKRPPPPTPRPPTPPPQPPTRRWSKDEKSPYEILGVSLDATQSQVRKAYRALAKEYHPDKVKQKSSDATSIATEIFEEVVAAYGVLGDPDNRAAFDDFGGGRGGEDADGFETYAEYKAALKKKEQENGGQTKGPQNFYTGASLVTNLSEELWDRRVKGDQIWMLEFYAPWCTHCKGLTKIWKETAEELENDVSFGAINCEAHRQWCMGPRWGIASYPTVKIIHASEDVVETYPVQQAKTKASLLQFARVAMADWRWLFSSHRVVALNDLVSFQQTLLEDPMESFWVVLFSNGFRCEDCGTARTNMIRLSAAVTGIARVATVDCSLNIDMGDPGTTNQSTSVGYNPLCAQHLGMAQGAGAAGNAKLMKTLPLIRGYAQGGASRKSIGSQLIDPKEIGGAALVELLETTILLTLSDVMIMKEEERRENATKNNNGTLVSSDEEGKEFEANARAVEPMKSEEEQKKKKYEEKVPPPPPPGGPRGYGGRPKRTAPRRVGGRGNRKFIGGRL